MTHFSDMTGKLAKYEKEHAGAHYTFQDGKFCNSGNVMEDYVKIALSCEGVGKHDSVPYDKGDDIPELQASVKSNRFTLVNSVLGDTQAEIIDTYFENVHSTTFIYARLDGQILITYHMDARKWRKFLEKFTTFDKTRKVLRGKSESAAMLSWLHTNV